jgi:hypothetical protein
MGMGDWKENDEGGEGSEAGVPPTEGCEEVEELNEDLKDVIV